MPSPLLELLTTGRVRSDRIIHLFCGASGTALCGLHDRLMVSAAPFRTRPCGGCLDAALVEGHLSALERCNVLVNLRRVTLVSQRV